MLKVNELNEIDYTELILSIDVKLVMARLLLTFSKGARPKIILMEMHAASACETLKNKYEPVSVPSMVKLAKQFRESFLKKGQDTEVSITGLEDLRVRLDDMRKSIDDSRVK
jgi:hypothetical protein